MMAAPGERRLGRRAVLVAVTGLALSGCGPVGPMAPAPADDLGAPTELPRSLPEPTVSLAPLALLPAAEAWSPLAGEVEPDVKVAAARVVEALGALAHDRRSVQQRLSDAGADPALAALVGPLVPPASPAVTRVIYPQYGGLTDQMASVMVIAEQSWVAEAGVVRRTVTADVRVRRTGGAPRVVDVIVSPAAAPAAGPGPVSGPVAALVAEPNVVLPDAARADLASGLVDPLVVEALLALAASYRLDVSVFRSGHPDEVFGTRTTSNHTRGRAVDVWAIDGLPVVMMANDDPRLLGFLDAARDAGSDEIGGPVDRDGPGGAHFANALHRDHVHIGFDR